MAETVTRAHDPSRARASATLPNAASRRCPTCGAHYPADFLVCPKDATALDQHERVSEDPLIGEVLAGTFMITGLLGSGGMGRVYEAEHVRLPKRFAVKVMHEQFASNSDSAARFEREAQAAARIVNDHVLEVVDLVRAQGRGCIVTELLEGEELGDLLDRTRKLPLPTAIAICRQVCRGLDAAHAVGVVHRDLKPSNLYLIKREGGGLHVKILDFGIAKLADGSKLTQTGAVLGTPAYMAPEQALGSPDVDVHVDIYAVGALLYRMLTGEPPFPEDGDPAITLTRVLTEDPRRPRDHDKSIPEGVEALIQRAMARSPEARPATMLELDRLLSAFDAPKLANRAASSAAILGTEPTVMGIALGDTVAVVTPPPVHVHDADTATRRARRSRPAAAALTVIISLTAGAAVLMVAALALRIATGRSAASELETILMAVLTLLATLFVFLASLRVLISRWRSALAVERLGEGLRGALRWYLSSLGVVTFAWLGYTIFVVTPQKEWLGWIQLGMVLVPTLLSATVLTVALRRAWRI